MKKTHASSATIILCMLVAGMPQAAEVYRELDDSGVPSFSDRNSDSTETIKIPETSTFSNRDFMEQRQRTRQDGKDEQAGSGAIRYTRLEITNPANNAAVRENSGALTLSVSIVPALRAGHTAELIMDGLAIRKLTGTGQVALANVDRGTHQFGVRILDGKGNEIDVGPVISLTMLRVLAKVIRQRAN